MAFKQGVAVELADLSSSSLSGSSSTDNIHTDNMPSSSLTAIEEKTFLVEEPVQKLPQWTAPESAKSRYVDALWVALNTIATIVIVFMNKLSVLRGFGFTGTILMRWLAL